MSTGDWVFTLAVFFALPLLTVWLYWRRYPVRRSVPVMVTGLVLTGLGVGLLWVVGYAVYAAVTPSDQKLLAE